MKSCEDCDHMVRHESNMYCLRKGFPNATYCPQERINGECGFEGKNWEPIPKEPSND